MQFPCGSISMSISIFGTMISIISTSVSIIPILVGIPIFESFLAPLLLLLSYLLSFSNSDILFLIATIVVLLIIIILSVYTNMIVIRISTSIRISNIFRIVLR